MIIVVIMDMVVAPVEEIKLQIIVLIDVRMAALKQVVEQQQIQVIVIQEVSVKVEMQ